MDDQPKLMTLTDQICSPILHSESQWVSSPFVWKENVGGALFPVCGQVMIRAGACTVCERSCRYCLPDGFISVVSTPSKIIFLCIDGGHCSKIILHVSLMGRALFWLIWSTVQWNYCPCLLCVGRYTHTVVTGNPCSVKEGAHKCVGCRYW